MNAAKRGTMNVFGESVVLKPTNRFTSRLAGEMP